MPDALAAAWATPGLVWLVLIIFGSGVVRGFAGFGTGLIFIPLGAIFLPPIWVLTALIVVDVVGTLPLAPRAWRDGSPPEIAMLALGCALLLPLGTMLLQTVDPQAFRWIVASLALGIVLLLASGWRHHVQLGRRALLGIGGASGFLGGFTGMPGPPVILAYMSGQYEPARIRGNTLMYFLAFESMLGLTFLARGLFIPEAFAIGVLLLLPYVAGNLIGAAIFDPRHARLYRWVAHGIMAASAVVALPLFG